MMRPKSKGSGIMVSDFICEKHDYLELTDEEYDEVKKTDPTIRKHARQTLEYGEGKEGYWTSDRFMLQIKEAVKIADVKFPREAGWRLCGCLTTVVATRRCLMMHLMHRK